jgi:hypothetical protein
MAKRSTSTEPYRPVRESLVSEVLGGATPPASPPSEGTPGAAAAAATAAELVPAPPSRPVVVKPPPAAAQRWERPRAPVVVPAADEDQGELVFDNKTERLTREKRVMLSATEEERVEDLVRSIARELRTPVKLSHVLRAFLGLVLRSREELLVQARVRPVERPPNGDTAAIAAFERSLGVLLDSALRLTRPPS